MSASPIAHINLVPRPIQKKRAQSRCTKRWSVVAAATIAFIGLPGIYIGGNAALSDSAIRSQIDMVHNQLKTNESAIPVLETKLNGLRAQLEVLELVDNRIDWRSVFSMLVQASGEEVRFTGIRATGGGVEGDQSIEIIINGIATTQTAARSYIVSLESLEIFDSVDLTSTTRREVNESEIIEFEVFAVVPSRTVPSGATP